MKTQKKQIMKIHSISETKSF